MQDFDAFEVYFKKLALWFHKATSLHYQAANGGSLVT
jgi:hypothetical protein